LSPLVLTRYHEAYMGELLKETQESWQRFSAIQKVAAVATNALTISRPLITSVVSKRGLDKSHEWTPSDTTTLAVGYLTDLEGGIARAAGAQTKLGGILDPVADKIATNMQEMVLAYRGEESYTNVALKLARDIGISALRKYALAKTSGVAKVSAGLAGKANTAFRKSQIVFATSPLGKKYPRVRSGLQTASMIATVASGVVTGAKIVKELNKKPNA
jgi:phosphatidylglycerophosphate synthase